MALAFAAVCLLAALMFNPFSLLTKDICRDSDVMHAVCMFGSLGALLAGAAALLMAVLGFLAPTPSRGRVLHAGEFLGKGPYRRYDCTPTAQLVEGVLASIETAAEHLTVADRDRTGAIVARARQHAAAGGFHEAVKAAAEATAIFTRAVEAARGDETVRTAAPSHPHRPS
jgi:hypothetical protein